MRYLPASLVIVVMQMYEERRAQVLHDKTCGLPLLNLPGYPYGFLIRPQSSEVERSPLGLEFVVDKFTIEALPRELWEEMNDG